MNKMSNFEVLANDIGTGIETAGMRIEDFGYDHDRRYAVSCIHASVVSWMTSFEERRLVGGSFPELVISRLPDHDDQTWGNYIQPPPTASLKRRMEAMWGIRVASTHAAGYISGIDNIRNRGWAEAAPQHIRGCRIDGDFLDCSSISLHECTRSIVHIQDLLGTT